MGAVKTKWNARQKCRHPCSRESAVGKGTGYEAGRSELRRLHATRERIVVTLAPGTAKSVMRLATGLADRVGGGASSSPCKVTFFPSTRHPDRLCRAQPSLHDGYWGFILQEQSGRDVKLITSAKIKLCIYISIA